MMNGDARGDLVASWTRQGPLWRTGRFDVIRRYMVSGRHHNRHQKSNASITHSPLSDISFLGPLCVTEKLTFLPSGDSDR